MREAGFDEDRIASNLEKCWVWRNVFVAETDAEAERVGVPAFAAMVESRAALRNRIYRETGMRIEVPASDLPSARASVEHGFIHGSPERVAEAIAEIASLGIGGVDRDLPSWTIAARGGGEKSHPVHAAGRTAFP